MKTNLLSIDWGGNKKKNPDRLGSNGPEPAESLRSYIAFIHLAPLRDAIRPEDWLKKQHTIVSFAQHAARTLISEKDTFVIHRNEVCIISFGETTHEIASLNAAAIGHKIVRDLLGTEGVGRVALKPSVFALKDLLSPDESGSGAHPPPESAEGPSRPDRHGKRRRIHDLYQADGPAKIHVAYHPIWSIATRMAETFELVPCLQRRNAEPRYGYDALLEIRSDSDLIEFDIGNIESGLLDLKRAIDAGFMAKLVLPLHFNTATSNQGRTELVEIFPGLPAHVRERLSFALFGIPSGIPQGRLHQVFAMLRPMVQEVSVVLIPNAETGDTLWNVAARVRSVGISRLYIAMPNGRDGDIPDRMKSICSRAVSLGLKVGTLGLRNGRHAHSLSVAGCQDFGGPLFGGPFKSLPEPYTVHSSVFEKNN